MCYVPLYDQTYDDAAKEYLDGLLAWERDRTWETPYDDGSARSRYYWDEEADGPPNEERYRPAFTEEATCYQMYETVSEGTPVSPVCTTLDELERWMVRDGGFSPAAAQHFCGPNGGWAPSSMVITGVGMVNGVEGMAMCEKGK